MNQTLPLHTALRILVLLIVSALSLPAATLTVTSLNDSGPGTLRQAILDASPDDTINFTVTGNIVLTSELVISTNLCISGPGTNNLMVSVDLDPDVYSRIFNLTGGTNTIFGLTLAFGWLYDKGGAISNAGTLTVNDCVLAANVVVESYGAAICNSGSLTLNNVTIFNNETYAGWGGGIWNDGDATLNNCRVSGNRAYYDEKGGGIANGGSMSINQSIVADNFADDAGGGIWNAGTLSITATTLSGNWANQNGGAIWSGGTLTMTGSTVCSNGLPHGYGLAINNYGVAILNNSTISANTANGAGGQSALAVSSSGSFFMTNCTIAGNRGGINNPAGSVTLRNCLVADTCEGTIISADYNLFPTTNTIPHPSGNLNNMVLAGATDHCVIGQDPQLVILHDNGGPTLTHALRAGSPARDQGHSSGLGTDQRGRPRPLDDPAIPNADGGDGADIGAYEQNPAEIQNGPTFVVNTTDDLDDGVCTTLHCSLREAVQAANAFAGSNTAILFGIPGTINVSNWLPDLTNSMVLTGPGAGLLTVRRSGSGNYRIFTVASGVTVSISGLTLANGDTGYGGAINNSGNLTVSYCSFMTNRGSDVGGAILSSGNLTVQSCAFVGNSSAFGGAIYSYFGVVEVRDSTFSGNTAVLGGGLYLGGTVSVFNTTICSNRVGGSPCGGGGIYGSLTLRNTIVAGNTCDSYSITDGPDINGAVASLDFNLIQNPAGATISGNTAHNVIGVDPKLGPLQYNGGPTPTHALLLGSPALDAGYTGGLSTDQRGHQRTIDIPIIPNPAGGDGSDIGAFEVDNFVTAVEKLGADVRVKFVTSSNQAYRVEYVPTLPATNWTRLPDVVLGNGREMSITNSGAASQPQRFYRTQLGL